MSNNDDDFDVYFGGQQQPGPGRAAAYRPPAKAPPKVVPKIVIRRPAPERRRQRGPTSSDDDDQVAGDGAAVAPHPTPRQPARRRARGDDDDDDDDDEGVDETGGDADDPADQPIDPHWATENERDQAGNLRRCRRWVITAWMDHPLPRNAAGQYMLPLPVDNTGTRITYVIMQRELGANPTIPEQHEAHWQMYIETNNQVTYLQLRRLLGWNNRHDRQHRRIYRHWMAPARGSQEQNIRYCSKEDTRVPGTHTIILGTPAKPDAVGQWRGVVDEIAAGGTFGSLCQRDDLLPIVARCASGIQQVLAARSKPADWREVKCYIYWGPTGTGKSRSVFQQHGHDNVYVREKPRLPYEKVNYDGYTGQKVLFIDEFRETDVSLAELLRITDGHPYRLNIKYTFGYAKWDHVYIATNQCPMNFHQNEDEASRAALARRIPPENIIYFGPPSTTQSQRLSTPSTEPMHIQSHRTTPSPSPAAPRKLSIQEILAKYVQPEHLEEAMQQL